ncbi:FecR family protein [Cyclobacterium lianum]|uniref:FecR family protein n=1 Tax=Cyclobacterium lianum TaxID=388280 RepID=UPI001160BA42|nr:FecR family protein [Cyclobacterium lianum]
MKQVNGKIDAMADYQSENSSNRHRFLPIDISYALKISAVFILGILTFSVFVGNHTTSEKGSASELGVHVNKINLSDGSIVWLKSDSRLYYPEKFDQNSREVRLEGEAFFDVVHDKSRPFIIHSGDMITKVLGTSFNVRDYKKQAEKAVEVLTGSVKVTLNREDGTRENVVLKSREKVSYNKAAPFGEEVIKNEPPLMSGGSNMDLKFEEASIQEIIEKLNHVHNVRIKIKNEALSACSITADLTNETLDLCLEIISRAINAKYYQIDDQIFIDGKGCIN